MKITDGHVFLGKTIYMEQSPEDVVSNMDRLGVAASVVVAPPPGPFYDEANEYVREACSVNPGRLMPLYHANPLLEGMEEKVDTALSEQGFRGVKLSPTHDGYGVGGPRTDSVVEKARDHGAPVFIHSGDSIFCPPEYIASLASRFEDVNFVTSMSRRAPLAAEGKDNLYLMTRSFPTLAFQRGYASQYDLDRAIFVSDAPLGSLEVELKGAELAGLTEDTKEKIMGGNLLRILKK
jgi:predicted TIM-barrel fold metal-dependent hydrolase